MRMPDWASSFAAVVEGAEGGTLLGLACYFGVRTALGASVKVSAAVALAGTTAVLGVGALIVAVALYQHRRWSRSPAIFTQLLALPVAVSLLQSGRSGAGTTLVAAAAVLLVVLFHPATARLWARPQA